MTRQPVRPGNGKGWTADEIQKLRKLAREGTAEATAAVLGRTVPAVRMKAMKSGISFRPVQPAALRRSSAR
jgi:hypothetical protein